MKLNLIILFLCGIFYTSSMAQNIEYFVGKFDVNNICTPMNGYYYRHFEDINFEEYNIDTFALLVEIAPAMAEDTFDLQIYIQGFLIGATILTDSTFTIHPQTLSDPVLGGFGVDGEGKVVNDSLVIYNKYYGFISLSCKTFGYKLIENVQEGYPIPAPNAEWGYVTFYGPPGPGSGSIGSISKYDGNDTLLNNHTYQHWGGSTFTRYNDNKLYSLETYNLSNDSLVELVYYDFNLAVNDTFFLPYIGFNFYAIVDEVSEFTTLNGQIRKEILLKTEDFTCSYRLRWIEGIGDIDNGLFYKNQLGLCDIYDRIVCFSDSSGTVYKEPNFDFPCDSLDTYTTVINNLIETSKLDHYITIFPNPAKCHLNLTFSNNTGMYADQFIIYNLNGVKILQHTINYDSSTIDISLLKNGSYIIHFLNDEVSIASGRFVKIE